MTLLQAHLYIVQSISSIYNTREATNVSNVLLEHITQLTKVERIVKANENLTPQQFQQLEQFVIQLQQHKPIQQIIGYSYFLNNKFLVNEYTLIPRPETEELVQLIINENRNRAIKILDIGTGTGSIAISLKKYLPNTTITAIDISSNALQIAKKNADNLNTEINFLQFDFLDENNWQQLNKYDIIVSNPPYISYEEKAEMKQNVLLHEPHTALFTPNNDVLIFYKLIAQFAQQHLTTNGKIYVEINEHLASETTKVFAAKGFATNVIQDFQQKNRIVTAQKLLQNSNTFTFAP